VTLEAGALNLTDDYVLVKTLVEKYLMHNKECYKSTSTSNVFDWKEKLAMDVKNHLRLLKKYGTPHPRDK
jgi:hypothetical protein